MTMQAILHDLPQVYSHFLPDFFQEQIPQETLATCDTCAMCLKPGDTPVEGRDYFVPNVKCCSFHPALPNYLVGGMLSTTEPSLAEGRSRLRAKIQRGVGVSPHGIHAPQTYSLMYGHSQGQHFGKSTALLCPYFDSDHQNCTIWPIREAVCSTYFCKSVAGEDGKAFWKALHDYLSHIQTQLAQYALLELGWPPAQILQVGSNATPLTLEALEERPAKDYRVLWGEWAGREEDLYRESYRLVSQLSQDDFERLMGVSQQLLLAFLKETRTAVVAPQVPERLMRNPALLARKLANGKYLLSTEAGSYIVSSAAYQSLEWFDGTRTNHDVATQYQQQTQIAMRDSFLLTFYRHRILINATLSSGDI